MHCRKQSHCLLHPQKQQQQLCCSGTISEAAKSQIDLAHTGQHQLQAQLPQQMPQHLSQQLHQQLHWPSLTSIDQLSDRLKSEAILQTGLSETAQQQLQCCALFLGRDPMELPGLALATEAAPEPSLLSLESKQPLLQLAESASNEAKSPGLLSADASEDGLTHTSLVSELGLSSQHCREEAASEGAFIQVASV